MCISLFNHMYIYIIHYKLYLIIFNHIFSNDIFISFHLMTIQEWVVLSKDVRRGIWGTGITGITQSTAGAVMSLDRVFLIINTINYSWTPSKLSVLNYRVFFGDSFPLKFNTIKHQKTMVDFIGDVHIFMGQKAFWGCFLYWGDGIAHPNSGRVLEGKDSNLHPFLLIMDMIWPTPAGTRCF